MGSVKPGTCARERQSEPMERLQRQIEFLVEIDKLKTIQRRTWLLDQSRYENDAEHSWHLAMMILCLSEHSDFENLDTTRCLKMVLVHDLVEIDAGDTYAFDEAAHDDKEAREKAAADRLFAILPPDQEVEFRQLWEEFEARETPESRFSNSVDRMQPLLHNCLTGGREWKKNGVTLPQVLKRCRPIEEGSEKLWQVMEQYLERAVADGLLKE